MIIDSSDAPLPAGIMSCDSDDWEAVESPDAEQLPPPLLRSLPNLLAPFTAPAPCPSLPPVAGFCQTPLSGTDRNAADMDIFGDMPELLDDFQPAFGKYLSLEAQQPQGFPVIDVPRLDHQFYFPMATGGDDDDLPDLIFPEPLQAAAEPPPLTFPSLHRAAGPPLPPLPSPNALRAADVLLRPLTSRAPLPHLTSPQPLQAADAPLIPTQLLQPDDPISAAPAAQSAAIIQPKLEAAPEEVPAPLLPHDSVSAAAADVAAQGAAVIEPTNEAASEEVPALLQPDAPVQAAPAAQSDALIQLKHEAAPEAVPALLQTDSPMYAAAAVSAAQNDAIVQPEAAPAELPALLQTDSPMYAAAAVSAAHSDALIQPKLEADPAELPATVLHASKVLAPPPCHTPGPETKAPALDPKLQATAKTGTQKAAPLPAKAPEGSFREAMLGLVMLVGLVAGLWYLCSLTFRGAQHLRRSAQLEVRLASSTRLLVGWYQQQHQGCSGSLYGGNGLQPQPPRPDCPAPGSLPVPGPAREFQLTANGGRSCLSAAHGLGQQLTLMPCASGKTLLQRWSEAKQNQLFTVNDGQIASAKGRYCLVSHAQVRGAAAFVLSPCAALNNTKAGRAAVQGQQWMFRAQDVAGSSSSSRLQVSPLTASGLCVEVAPGFRPGSHLLPGSFEQELVLAPCSQQEAQAFAPAFAHPLP